MPKPGNKKIPIWIIGIALAAIVLLAALLRFYQLGKIPPSPYWDEVALGYDAYSLFKTGKDHHGNPWPVTAFESYGDWKPGLYIYTLIPFIALFDLNSLALRLPSAFFGTLTVLFVFLLVRQLHKTQTYETTGSWFIALLSALFLALIPWHILVSRVGFETNVALFLVTVSVFAFVKGIEGIEKISGKVWLVLSFTIGVLSLYAYHAERLFTPLLLIALSMLYWKHFWSHKKTFISLALLSCILTLPLLLKLNDPILKQRFAETSALTTLDPVIASNKAIEQDGHAFFAKLMHHRYWYYADIIVKNYMSHFSPKFLFVSGDENLRHSTGFTGQLYIIQMPLLIMAVVLACKRRERWLLPVIIWLFLSPVPAALTKAVPHALRALPMVVPLAILSGYGFYGFVDITKEILQKTSKLPLTMIGSSIIAIAILGTIALESTQFYDYYLRFYPQKTSKEWQYGYQELMTYLYQNHNQYDSVVVTRDAGRPAMYYWFYNKIEPWQVQEWNLKAQKDQGEYLQFENFSFGASGGSGKWLEVSIKQKQAENPIKTITYLDGQPAFYIYEH